MLELEGIKPLAERKANPLPVLFVVRELGSGGIERDVTKLAKGLPRERFAIYVATYKAEGPRFEELKEAGIPIFPIDLTSLKSVRALGAAIRFARLIRKERVAILHAWDASAVFATPIARLLRVPVVISSMLGSRELLDRKSRKQLQWTDGLVDRVIVNCEFIRTHLLHDYGVPPERVEICYNGVETSEFYPAEEAKPAELAGATLVIGSVCVLRREKALELLIEAFSLVRDKVAGSKLLIVGSGPERQKLEDLSARLGIAQDCIFLPAMRNVARYMRAIDIFVSCSYSEAFSNSILEAMSCGRCVVASRVGGTPELIADGERGLLFESGNTDELAQKLTVVMEDADKRREFGRRAAEFARTKFNIDVAVRRLTEIYEDMLRRKSGFVN